MDLPGLAYVGDEGNASVIKQCREALCLVTYNSAETDKQKVNSLLQEVVEQVKDLGGSPARMLFVLNRIDVFRADRNYPETENRFVENAISSIKKELTEHLREHKEDIEKLQVVKLSTWPALLALQIKNNDEICSAEACKKADNHFNGLIDEHVLEDLPRKVERWSRHDRARVADSLWQRSYAEEFLQHLRGHVSEHFPRLVIPQAIERFNIAAGNAVTEWALQTTTAILNSSEERYKQECEKISLIKSSLEGFLETSDKNLREPFEKIKQVLIDKSTGENELFHSLRKNISDLTKDDKKPYKQLEKKLYPLYGWKNELGQGINKVLEPVAKSLENGKVILDTPNLKRANVIHVNLLSNCLERLIRLGYAGPTAKSGKKIEAKTDKEQKNLRDLNKELNELAMHLNLVMEDVFKQIINQESERMYESVVALFNHHLSHLETGANNIAPNIAIRFPESQMVKIDNKLNIYVSFKAGFAITSGTWKEEIQVPREERLWYTLFLLSRTVYDTEYRTRSSENGNIPSVENLLEGWVLQARKAESEIVESIISWLLEQINCLKTNVDKVQQDVIERYQQRLDTAKKEITVDYEMQKNIWQPMQTKAHKLTKTFQDLDIFLD